MAIVTESTIPAESKSVALPAVIDLDTLDIVRDGLIDAIELGSVAVDASKVERVASNGLFMLLSAAKTAQRNRFEFSIEAPSVPMRAAIDRLGLNGVFSGLMKG